MDVLRRSKTEIHSCEGRSLRTAGGYRLRTCELRLLAADNILEIN